MMAFTSQRLYSGVFQVRERLQASTLRIPAAEWLASCTPWPCSWLTLPLTGPCRRRP
jgi:hypothetical protein